LALFECFVEVVNDFVKAGSGDLFAVRAYKENLDAPITQGHLLCCIAAMETK